MAFKRYQDGYARTKVVDDGAGGKTTAYHIGNGMYISKVKYKWSIKENGYVADFRDKKEKTRDETPSQDNAVAEQPQIPENPGIRKEAYSTYGVSIPVSVGRRVVTGNIVDATDLIPVLIGAKTTVTEITVPVYNRDYGPG
jgi:hypothetical protein